MRGGTEVSSSPAPGRSRRPRPCSRDSSGFLAGSSASTKGDALIGGTEIPTLRDSCSYALRWYALHNFHDVLHDGRHWDTTLSLVIWVRAHVETARSCCIDETRERNFSISEKVWKLVLPYRRHRRYLIFRMEEETTPVGGGGRDRLASSCTTTLENVQLPGPDVIPSWLEPPPRRATT